jgi:hypothetical protein
VDGDAQQEAKRIDEDVPLAAGDLLAGIEILRIERGAPFCAALVYQRDPVGGFAARQNLDCPAVMTGNSPSNVWATAVSLSRLPSA